MSELSHFWSKVDKRLNHECWNWTGCICKGYGNFGIYDRHTGLVKVVKAHRYMYELSRKIKIPKDMLICHLCNNRRCVNPTHLYCGTHLDNMSDRSKNDSARSTKISLSHAKFYSGEIWLIRKLKGHISSRTSAKIFKCDKGTIINIWKSSFYPCKEGEYV